jgi:hypothetical protein
MDPPEGGGGQEPPDRGELRTDPSLDMPPQEAVVPELYAQHLVIEEVDQKFYPRADRAAQERQGKKAQPFRRERRQGGHGQPVNGA